MTKAERICELYKTGKFTTREIADVVGCRPEYVRVVARQRRGGAASECDRRYLAAGGLERKLERQKRLYHSDPDFRRRRLDSIAKWCRENREYLAAYKRAWRARRKAEARAS